ncbi:MAG: SusC/RagA family TonB-linked outer membrane protein [Chitinophagales bacterium]
MKMRILLLLTSFFIQLFFSVVLAQAFEVNGKITNKASGEVLSGATVKVKGTNMATLTDVNGSFSIKVPGIGNVLVITYIGMVDQEIPVTSAAIPIIVQLEPRANSLNEVVVIGYGTQKRANVTGSISSVKAKDLESMPVNRIEQSLQGRTSGLTIAQSSGAPGASATVRIRGITSINNSNPLYIVDGVPIDIGGIDYLNQYDIESIEVLKDAASAAIYGTRAAGGVILITTKKGRSGALHVGYNGYYGVQSPERKLNLLNAEQYATLRNEASLNAGGDIIFADPASLGKGTNWQDLLFNNSAQIQDHEVNISGGNDRSTFYSSFGFFNQEGIVSSSISNYKRLTIRLNSSHKLANWVTFGENLGYSYIKSQGGLNTNSEFGGPLSSAINLDPITPSVITNISAQPNATEYLNNSLYTIKDPFGNPYGISYYVGQEMTNPLAYIQTQQGNFGWSHNIVGNAYLEIKPIKGLQFRSNIGAKLAFYGNESFTPLFYLSATNKNTVANSFFRQNSQGLIWNWDNTISYTRSYQKHNLTALAGMGVQENSASGVNNTASGLPITSFGEASMNWNIPAANRIGGGYENQPYRLVSYFGRINYDYNGRYLFTGILRADGSSRFGSNNRFGYFPSASAGWVPTKEVFWPDNKIVNFLKIRGSYGVNGNDQSLSDFQYVSTVGGGFNYTFGENNLTTGYAPNAPANPDLKWEQTSQTDLGFDATIYKDFTVTFDYFIKKTTGMLLQVKIPGYVGASGNPYGNVADLRDKGVELELGYNKKIGDVNVNFRGNVSYVTNSITNIGLNDYLTGATFQASAYEIERTAVGHPLNAFYGFKTLGIFQTQAQINSYTGKDGNLIQPNARPGDFIWADLNGDGKISSDDRIYIGDPTPNWTFGFTASASWKNFDVTIFGLGVAGNEIFQGLRRLDILTANWTTKALTRWTGPGTSNSFPRLSTSDPNGNFTNPSSFYLSDGSYFRIKNLQIGYTLPTKLLGKYGVQRIRIYASASNLVTFTKYSGFDPEIGGSSFSIDRGVYPQARTFLVGLNLGF